MKNTINQVRPPYSHKGFTLLLNHFCLVGRCFCASHSCNSELHSPELRPSGFTLAETLITLVIIGVIAAITVPALINKINDKQYEVARRIALNTIGEAGRSIAVDGNMNSASNAEDFVKNYLSKKLSIVKMCSGTSTAHLEKCGLPQRVKTLNGNITNMSTIYNFPYGSTIPSNIFNNQPSYGFVTANGYSVNLFYNKNCTLDTVEGNYLPPNYVCFNAIYDMNGLNKPNQVGKDIGFVTVIFPNYQSRAIAPNPTQQSIQLFDNANLAKAKKVCSDLGKDYYLPDLYETVSIAFNRIIVGISDDRTVWTSTPNWIVYLSSGTKRSFAPISSTHPICVKK